MKLVGKTKSVTLLVLILCVVMLLGVAIGGRGETQKYELIYIPKTLDESNGFWSSLIEGAKMAAEDNNVELSIRAGYTEEDYEYQNKLIEKAITESPDALLVSPCSYTRNTEVLKKAKQKGIKIMLIDSEINEDIGQKLVSTDNEAAGVELGNYAAGLLNADSQVGIIGHVKGTSTAIQREKGVRKGLGEYESQVQEVVYCGSSYDRAYALAEQMVTKFPGLDMIVGLNEYSALGAARAIEDMGIKEQVSVVGFDNSVEQIQLMEKGVFKGIVIQKPFNMGYLGVEECVEILDGKRVERRLDSGCRLITMENLYEEENQKLLYPFVGR